MMFARGRVFVDDDVSSLFGDLGGDDYSQHVLS